MTDMKTVIFVVVRVAVVYTAAYLIAKRASKDG